MILLEHGAVHPSKLWAIFFFHFFISFYNLFSIGSVSCIETTCQHVTGRHWAWSDHNSFLFHFILSISLNVIQFRMRKTKNNNKKSLLENSSEMKLDAQKNRQWHDIARGEKHCTYMQIIFLHGNLIWSARVRTTRKQQIIIMKTVTHPFRFQFKCNQCAVKRKNNGKERETKNLSFMKMALWKWVIMNNNQWLWLR